MVRDCRKMDINSKLKIINIMSGARFGGAESFFERLAISFAQNQKIKQKVIIKSNKERIKKLQIVINDIEQIVFFNFLNPLCSYKIKNSIEEFKPDIVLTWMNRASRLLPPKKIKNEIYVGRLGGYYDIKNYAKCDFLITNTQDLKNFVISKGWDRKNVEFIPNFVSNNQISASKIYPTEKRNIICMGRFHHNKAIDILIKSMPFLPSFNLSIVGEGLLENSYRNLIKKFNLNSRVKLYKWSNNISSFLNKASMLVCPSRHEPFGNIVVDGWAHKIPVIVSNVGGPGLMVRHRFNGLKFEKDNVFDLVEKIKTLNSDENLKKKVTINGYKTFKKNYSEKVIVLKYINFFKRICKLCAE